MVVWFVTQGDALALAFTVRFGVNVLTHGGGVLDGAGIIQGGDGHSSSCKSASNIVEAIEVTAVRMIQVLAVCVRLRIAISEA